MANQAIIKNLPGIDDLIITDKLIHHSILQALCRESKNFKRYNHLDLDHLEKILARNIR